MCTSLLQRIQMNGQMKSHLGRGLEGSPTQELLSLWGWGALPPPPSVHMHMFAILFREFCGAFIK